MISTRCCTPTGRSSTSASGSTSKPKRVGDLARRARAAASRSSAPPKPGRLVAEHDVLGDGEDGDEHEVLVHHADAGAPSRRRGRRSAARRRRAGSRPRRPGRGRRARSSAWTCRRRSRRGGSGSRPARPSRSMWSLATRVPKRLVMPRSSSFMASHPSVGGDGLAARRRRAGTENGEAGATPASPDVASVLMLRARRYDVDLDRAVDDAGLDLVELGLRASGRPWTRSRGTARGRRPRSRACRRTASESKSPLPRGDDRLVASTSHALQDRGEVQVADVLGSVSNTSASTPRGDVLAGVVDGGQRRPGRSGHRRGGCTSTPWSMQPLGGVGGRLVGLEATGERAVLGCLSQPRTLTSLPFSSL